MTFSSITFALPWTLLIEAEMFGAGTGTDVGDDEDVGRAVGDIATRDGVGVGVWVTDLLGDEEGEAIGDGVEITVGVGVGEGVDVAVGIGVEVGDGAGEFARRTKIFTVCETGR